MLYGKDPLLAMGQVQLLLDVGELFISNGPLGFSKVDPKPKRVDGLSPLGSVRIRTVCSTCG